MRRQPGRSPEEGTTNDAAISVVARSRVHVIVVRTSDDVGAAIA